MKYFLILIMVMAAIMIIAYFIALFTKKHKWLIYFRITMLLLIAFLLVAWIASIILGQHLILLLGLAIIFIVMYAFS